MICIVVVPQYYRFFRKIMLHMLISSAPLAQGHGKTREIIHGLYLFASQHGKGLDKTPVSFQIFHSRRREGMPGKQFAGE
jgi:hypothetical protein